MTSGGTTIALGGGQKKVNIAQQIQYDLIPMSSGGAGNGSLYGNVLGDTLDLQLVVTVLGFCLLPFPPCGQVAYKNLQIQVPLPKSGGIDTQVDLVTLDGQHHLPARLIMRIR